MAPTSLRNKVGNRRRSTYLRPPEVKLATLASLLSGWRSIPEEQQARFEFEGGASVLQLWCAGDVSLVKRPSVAIVGTRNISELGAARARKLAREISRAGVVVVSGLAKGVDTEALTAAIDEGGSVIGVIGTPIDRAYPVENERLQERIYRDHLLISQFEPGKRVFRSNFPERNKLMAAISDATVIIEASDTSGTLHQAAECVRLGRWLFISRSLMNAGLQWPSKFKDYPVSRILTHTEDVLEALRESTKCPLESTASVHTSPI